jgi:hypothetical protein
MYGFCPDWLRKYPKHPYQRLNLGLDTVMHMIDSLLSGGAVGDERGKEIPARQCQ